MNNEVLHVIAVISNPVRYKSRVRLYNEFARRMMANSNIVLTTVEAAFGDRPFEVTDAGNGDHVQVRTQSEIWHKENLVNLGLAHTMKRHPNAFYFAWVDADIDFCRNDWAEEAIHQLQHYAVVQLWSDAIDLGPKMETLGRDKSFCSYLADGKKPVVKNPYERWHPGYAWAARLDGLKMLQGREGGSLIDTALLGAADYFMAYGFMGLMERTLYNDVGETGFHKGYVDGLLQWQDRAKRIKGNLGVVSGTILHHFHGRKTQRFYTTRENILIQNQYNPDTDLTRDINGLYELVVEDDRQRNLRDAVRAYFRARNEDTIETDKYGV